MSLGEISNQVKNPATPETTEKSLVDDPAERWDIIILMKMTSKVEVAPSFFSLAKAKRFWKNGIYLIWEMTPYFPNQLFPVFYYSFFSQLQSLYDTVKNFDKYKRNFYP
jgi:hypothetical protein